MPPGHMPCQARQATRGTPDLLVLSGRLPDALHVHTQRAEEQTPVEAQAPEQDAVVPARGHRARVSVGVLTSVAPQLGTTHGRSHSRLCSWRRATQRGSGACTRRTACP